MRLLGTTGNEGCQVAPGEAVSDRGHPTQRCEHGHIPNMGIYLPFSDLPQQLTSVVPLPPSWDQTVGGGETVQSRARKEHSGRTLILQTVDPS